jgi:MshEN domain
MSNDADSATALPAGEATQALYTYETIDSLARVRAAFQELLSYGNEQIALVIIRLHYDLDDLMQPATPAINRGAMQLTSFRQTARSDARHELALRSTRHLLDSLRVLVRKTDRVFLHDHAMYFVLRGSNQQGGQIVQARLWEALLWRVHNLSEPEMLRPHNMTIGHSGYQEAQASIECCIDAARIVQLRYEWHSGKSRKMARHIEPEHPTTLEPVDEELPTLARKLGIPYLTLLPRKLPVSLQQLVTPTLAHELRCLPVGRERDTLTVAMLDPQNAAALDRLRTETGLHIFPVLTHPQALQSALEHLV